MNVAAIVSGVQWLAPPAWLWVFGSFVAWLSAGSFDTCLGVAIAFLEAGSQGGMDSQAVKF